MEGERSGSRVRMDDRYSRQIRFKGIGREGQKRISEARAVVLGCGAIGSVSSEMLVRAGIGKLTVVDRDFVELSNLQRQSLFQESHAKESVPKALAAEEMLTAINSEVEIEGVIRDVTHENMDEFLENCDLVIDGSDNFELRFLVNDYSVKQGVPWIYAAAVGSYGLSFLFVPRKTPCLRCLFEDPLEPGEAETCETAGVLSPVIHAVCSFQVSEAMRYLARQEISSKLLQVDTWRQTWRTIEVGEAREDCPCCKQRLFPFLEGELHSNQTRLCGRNAVQISGPSGSRFDLEKLAGRLEGEFDVKWNPYLLRTEIEGLEVAIFADGRAMIKGTDDLARARSVYARYIGH